MAETPLNAAIARLRANVHATQEALQTSDLGELLAVVQRVESAREVFGRAAPPAEYMALLRDSAVNTVSAMLRAILAHRAEHDATLLCRMTDALNIALGDEPPPPPAPSSSTPSPAPSPTTKRRSNSFSLGAVAPAAQPPSGPQQNQQQQQMALLGTAGASAATVAAAAAAAGTTPSRPPPRPLGGRSSLPARAARSLRSFRGGGAASPGAGAASTVRVPMQPSHSDTEASPGLGMRTPPASLCPSGPGDGVGGAAAVAAAAAALSAGASPMESALVDGDKEQQQQEKEQQKEQQKEQEKDEQEEEHHIVVPTRKLQVGGDDDEDKSRREYIEEEILVSEQSYVDGLRVLVEVYERPLREAGIVPEESVALLFGNVGELYAVNRELLAALGAARAQHRTGAVFQAIAPRLEAYTRYGESFDEASALLQRLKKSSGDFRKFLARQRAQHSDVVSLDLLDALLITPIQRLPRYNLLLADLIRSTPAGDADLPALRAARDMMLAVAARVNERIKQSENTQRLQNVVRTIIFPSDDIKEDTALVRPGRLFVREGDCQFLAAAARDADRHPKKKPAHLFLFSDLLVMTMRKRMTAYYVFRRALSLRTCTADKLYEDPTRMVLKQLREPIGTVFFASEDERDQWAYDILKAHVELEDEPEPSPSAAGSGSTASGATTGATTASAPSVPPSRTGAPSSSTSSASATNSPTDSHLLDAPTAAAAPSSTSYSSLPSYAALAAAAAAAASSSSGTASPPQQQLQPLLPPLPSRQPPPPHPESAHAGELSHSCGHAPPVNPDVRRRAVSNSARLGPPAPAPSPAAPAHRGRASPAPPSPRTLTRSA